MDSKTSMIEPHEELEARAVVADEFFKLTGTNILPRPCGPWLAVKIFIRPDEIKTIKDKSGKEVTLYLPQVSQAQDKYANCVGLVMAVGPGAYKGNNPDGSPRFPEGPWCKVGDWIVFPRYESHVFMYKGVAMMTIYDDKVQMVVPDPTWVQAGHTVDKV